jgi:hypothetical protein
VHTHTHTHVSGLNSGEFFWLGSQLNDRESEMGLVARAHVGACMEGARLSGSKFKGWVRGKCSPM